MRLKDKVAIISGATSGIGESTALLFAQEGAKVAVVGRNIQHGEEIVREIRNQGGDAIFIKADVSKEVDVSSMIQKTVEHYGKLDILFANAGIGALGDLHKVSLEDWNQLITIDLTGGFLCNKYAIQQS